jgi:hypothetical protein
VVPRIPLDVSCGSIFDQVCEFGLPFDVRFAQKATVAREAGDERFV